MERPTSGRRHVRAGSVTVAELIRKRPAPVRVPAGDEAVTEEIVTGPLAAPTVVPPRTTPRTHRRTPVRSRQLAKLAGLGVAAAVLCASVAAASIINTRRQAGAEITLPPAAEMSDEQALLPDLFTLGAGGTAAPQRRVTGLPAPTTGTAATSVEKPSAATRTTATSADNRRLAAGGQQPAPASEAADTERVDTELVRQFYRLLGSTPTAALGLLDSTLRASDLSRFVDSWSQVRDIQLLDVRRQPDGTLLAVVDMVVPDGGRMRVRQLLRTTGGQPQRIIGAEIISAQRS